MLSEISQTKKEKYCMISLYMCNLKKPNDTENRLVIARGQGGR